MGADQSHPAALGGPSRSVRALGHAVHMERVDLIPDGALRAHTIVERPVITAEPEAVAAPIAAAATARSFSRFAAQLNGR
jgi:hypothetical protein